VVLTRGFINTQHQEYSVSKLESEYGNKLSELTIKIQSARACMHIKTGGDEVASED